MRSATLSHARPIVSAAITSGVLRAVVRMSCPSSIASSIASSGRRWPLAEADEQQRHSDQRDNGANNHENALPAHRAPRDDIETLQGPQHARAKREHTNDHPNPAHVLLLASRYLSMFHDHLCSMTTVWHV